MEIINIQSRAKTVFIDITDNLRGLISSHGVKSGLCHVYVPHTTAGLLVNEGADPAVCNDIINHLDRLVPENARYSHLEGNSPAHIKSAMIGNSLELIIEDGGLVLGTWQRVFFCEFDGPRQRRVMIQPLSR